MSTELNITINETNATDTASAFATLAGSKGYVKQDASAAGTLDRIREALHIVHGQTVNELLDQWHIIVADRIANPPAAPAPATEVD
jgi:hypothetical protein